MPQPKERNTIDVRAERAVVAAVRLPESEYDASDPFGELRSLAEQAGAVVVGELTQNMPKPVAGTYMGTGKVTELKGLCETLDASTVIFDHDLSPRQIANIEEITGRKVIDRSELILDIFASRATTREAQLQVELAQVEYTLPRLRAMWTHLERIVGVGGIGGIGTRGPGEQQLEIDRRLAQAKRLTLVRELEGIQARKRREVKARKALHFTVGLVGYTNAGKSTLFNTLTPGGAYADNRLFATLTTRTRQWDLGGGLEVMLSDTVGFVRNLPHNLIASFKATLEEATHADVLLTVLDVADPAADLHYKVVTETLDELLHEAAEDARREGEEFTQPERILILNKADRLADNAELLIWQQRVPGSIPLCALPTIPGLREGQRPPGQDELTARLRDMAQGRVDELEISLPYRQSRAINLIETQGEVLDRAYKGDTVTFRVRIGRRQVDQLRISGATIKVAGEPDPGPKSAWSAE
jgi:GTPase